MSREDDCVAQVSYRVAPSGLVVSLDTLAGIKSRSRTLVMKCLAHHGLAWLDDLSGATELSRKYSEILMLNGRYGGLTDIVEQVRLPQYRYNSDRAGSGHFHASSKLVSAYGGYAAGLAIGVSSLMAVCYAWSLTTAADPDLVGVVGELRPEVEFFKRYVNERCIILDAYWRIARGRLDGTSAQYTK